MWAKIGFLGFGGPAGQIALMHRELVERRGWIDEPRFLHALNYCMLLPGPEAQQLATYLGWLLHRTRGGITAGVLFVAPGVAMILASSALYVTFHDLVWMKAVLFGLKAAVLALVVEAVLRIGKRAVRGTSALWMAGAAFIAIFFFDAPYPLVVLAAGVWGALLSIRVEIPEEQTALTHGMDAGQLVPTRPRAARTIRVAGAALGLWAIPLLVVGLAFGRESVFFQEGLFFSKAAMVTFGGAYAVLGYIAEEAVDTYAWLLPTEMLDGLGLAETTPGPLILVVQFVAFVGAFRNPADLPPMVAGVVGALITVWVTFVPSFLFIFVGAPYIEAARRSRRLSAALSLITAAVVGVVANLSIWFAMHVVFARVTVLHVGPLRLLVPDLATVDGAALALAVASTLAVLRFKAGVMPTMVLSTLLGALWKTVGPSR